jgi:hypothetical protein
MEKTIWGHRRKGGDNIKVSLKGIPSIGKLSWTMQNGLFYEGRRTTFQIQVPNAFQQVPYPLGDSSQRHCYIIFSQDVHIFCFLIGCKSLT